MPPNPDRFAPGLLEVTSLSSNRVDLVFDEPMQSSSAGLENFTVVSLEGETLGLVAVTVGPDNSTLTLLTRPQKPQVYVLRGAAKDMAGNEARFVRRFRGSIRLDTIAPQLLSASPRPFSTGLRYNLVVSLSFSEAIDTSGFPKVLVLPAWLRGRLIQQWSPTLASVRFTLRDSLPAGTVVSFILPAGAKDFSGNRANQGAALLLYSDSVALIRPVRGFLRTQGRALANGYVILTSDSLRQATLSLADGSFLVRIDSAPWSLLAVADTDYDGRSDLICVRAPQVLSDSIVLELSADSLSHSIDSVFGD
ncbi:MAG: Ig-like domain-containing protein [candidate division WOR-3 bacterium]